MQSQPSAGMADTLRGNITLLERHRRAEDAREGVGTRLSDAVTRFTGSLAFVALHGAVYGLWVLVNLGAVPGVPRFDPSFVILATEASVEAIFLSTFVLISQNRMAIAAQRRADLDLHINLLAEHELTRLAVLVGRIAERLDVTVDDPGFAEITRNVAPVEVLETIDTVRGAAD